MNIAKYLNTTQVSVPGGEQYVYAFEDMVDFIEVLARAENQLPHAHSALYIQVTRIINNMNKYDNLYLASRIRDGMCALRDKVIKSSTGIPVDESSQR